MSQDNYWTELPRLTVSSVGDLSCSHKYTELRIKKNWPKDRKPPPSSVPRGTAIHAAVHELFRNRHGEELPMTDLHSMARQAVYSARYERGVNRDDEVHHVVNAVKLLVDNTDPEDVAAVIALEVKVDVDYYYQGEGLVCFSAILDKVLVRPSEPDVLVLVDLKTGAQKIDLREACLMMYCSKKRWPQYRRCRLELVWLNSEDNSVEMDVIEERDVRGQLKLITTDLLRVLKNPPVKEPGSACHYCPLRKGCETVPPAA